MMYDCVNVQYVASVQKYATQPLGKSNFQLVVLVSKLFQLLLL